MNDQKISPRKPESPRQLPERPDDGMRRKSAKLIPLERKNSQDAVRSHLSDSEYMKSLAFRELTITPVKLTGKQKKKLRNKKKGLRSWDLTDDQISAQKAELQRLGIPALQIPSGDKAPKSSPSVSTSPRSGRSPHRHDEKVPVGTSTQRVLPETPRLPTSGHKVQHDSPRIVSAHYGVPTATRSDPSSARLDLLNHKLELKRLLMTGLHYQLKAAEEELKTLQRKRDVEVAALLQSSFAAFPPNVSGEEGADSNTYEDISETVRQLQEEDRHFQH